MKCSELLETSIQDFIDLLENLDKTYKGENLFLRCFPDGGSYISNDNGDIDFEFDNFNELLKFLKDKKND
ncbi:MAG: hypothetical protein KAR38_16335 [Calditrichia bacterium]|nr:hypothetical protein [Calditrichia bacterium]